MEKLRGPNQEVAERSESAPANYPFASVLELEEESDEKTHYECHEQLSEEVVTDLLSLKGEVPLEFTGKNWLESFDEFVEDVGVENSEEGLETSEGSPEGDGVGAWLAVSSCFVKVEDEEINGA